MSSRMSYLRIIVVECVLILESQAAVYVVVSMTEKEGVQCFRLWRSPLIIPSHWDKNTSVLKLYMDDMAMSHCNIIHIKSLHKALMNVHSSIDL